jgi:hypothetical protein
MAHKAFMLDPRYKGLKCVIDLIRKDRARVLVEEYDKKKIGSTFSCGFKVP